ncbi:MAG: polymerase, sigma-24 subunit, subfamily [Myxococcaceae bacterium]|nr:polymerase, sigma-24 subunit, subfamily [Myxococcaceae bacterium]
MGMQDEFERSGRFDARYVAFVATLEALRPKLHRYCTRMTGSVFDGEDTAQEAIFEAYRKLELYDSALPLAPWITRIAHNRCIDFIRREKSRAIAEVRTADLDEVQRLAEPSALGIDRALESLVTHLPPKERACILLKDVFDYSLAETAELVGSTVGGVKAALKRGRSKLAALPPAAPPSAGETPKLHLLYIERFNRRDWDGVRELIRDDALLRISDVYAGSIQRNYLTTFERMPFPFRLVPGEVDGEAVLVLLGGLAAGDVVSAVIRLDVSDEKIARISHYTRCPWLLRPARRLVVDGVRRILNQQALDASMLA